MTEYTGVLTSGANPLVTATAGGLILTDGAFLSEVMVALYDLRWAVLFIAMLVFTDLWSGLAASVRVRGEDFRISRAMRRTAAKFCEYVSFIIFALLLYKGCVAPFGYGTDAMGAGCGAVVALLIEADSIYGHVCDLHGIRNRPSLKRFFVAWLKRRSADAGAALEETLEEAEKKNKEQL